MSRTSNQLAELKMKSRITLFMNHNHLTYAMLHRQLATRISKL